MVDREAREQLAAALERVRQRPTPGEDQQWLAEFLPQWLAVMRLRSADPAISQIRGRLGRLAGAAPSQTPWAADAQGEAQREALDRCLRFLRSDLEYQWPVPAGSAAALVWPILALTVGGILLLLPHNSDWGLAAALLVGGAVAAVIAQRRRPRQQLPEQADLEAWPFLTREEAERQTGGSGWGWDGSGDAAGRED